MYNWHRVRGRPPSRGHPRGPRGAASDRRRRRRRRVDGGARRSHRRDHVSRVRCGAPVEYAAPARDIRQKIQVLCLWSKLEAAPLSQILSRSRRGHRRHVSPPALFLRHERRRHARRPHHVRAPRRRHTEDVRELPRAVHRREGDRPDGQAPLLQEQRLPPRHPELHVPGGRLHPRRRHRRRVHLRREVRR